MENRKTGVRHHPGCGQCMSESCSTSQVILEDALQGWRLGLAALVVFVVPCLLAIAGAFYGGRLQLGQLAGASVGLVIGLIAVGAMTRLVDRRETRS